MPSVRDFLIAWQVGNYKAASRHVVGGNQQEVTSALGQIRDQLDAASLKLAMGRIKKSGKQATARFSVKVDLGENGEPWTYIGEMRLRQIDGKWKVVWDPSIVHPSLRAGERLAVVSEAPERAAVQDAGGHSLLRTVPVEIFGVYPGRLADPTKTVKQLVDASQTDGGRRLDAERLVGRVRSAPPQAFLQLLALERPGNSALITRLRAIPGLEAKTVVEPIRPQTSSVLIGDLGPATAERLQQVGAPYQPGDTIGVSGLQLLYQRRLAGIPAVRVVAVDPQGRQQVLREWRGQGSEPVRTTLDRTVQGRAEYALSGLKVPASLIAVRSATGEILAVSNQQTGGRNLAMEGRYPPGMTFGIVSAAALLRGGTITADTATECPATTTVGNQEFTNPGGGRSKAALQMNFGYSCATTLASLSTQISASALNGEAWRFGFNRPWGLTVPAFSGTVPSPANDGEKAADAIGQGNVLASPLTMALVAGAVEAGTWRPPILLASPPDRQTAQPQFLEPTQTTALKKLLRRAVISGTAKEANVVGAAGTVSGAVATVNYTEGGRQKTVSWFAGSRSGIAFAIAIEGNIPAAQVAMKFLRGPR